MQRAYSEPLRFSFAHVYRAWQSCQRGKRGTKAAQRYEVRLLDHLMATVQALQNDSWHPSRATRFVTLRPKPREILAADGFQTAIAAAKASGTVPIKKVEQRDTRRQSLAENQSRTLPPPN